MNPQDQNLAKLIANVAQQCNVNSSQIEDIYPCTPLQHGIFIASAATEGTYIAQHVFKFRGNIDRERMKKAWATVIQSNAILRTRIVAIDTRAIQVVLKEWLPVWTELKDLSTYLMVDRQKTMTYGDPLLRLGISKTHLVWTAHHSVYDGYSIALMLEDIIKAYLGKDLSSRKPYRNFVKYVQTQNEMPESRSFWESNISRKDVCSFPIVSSSTKPLPNETMKHSAQLDIATSIGVTTATLVQAAWALVLSSHIGTSTISYGTTMSGRDADVVGIENIIGPTLGTVPICFDIDYDLTSAQYLQKVQNHFAKMIPYLHFGLQNIKKIGPGSAAACSFQNLLVVHSAQQENHDAAYEALLQRPEEEVQVDFLNYALTIQCSLASNGDMKAIASFDNSIIAPSRMKRLLLQLEHTICELAFRTDSALRHIGLVSPSDLRQIERWNQKKEKAIHSPMVDIERQISNRAQFTAVSAWDGTLSYSELDTQSSRLAEYLIAEYGVGPESIIPLCHEKSFWQIVAIVAIMKAGAAFTLLDPTYPVKRLEKLIELTDAKVVLVSSSCRKLFEDSSSEFLVFEETLFRSTVVPVRLCTALVSKVSFRQPSLDSPMYVVFTSGSTGTPKGVIITFGSYYAGARDHIPIYDLGPESRVLNLASPAFDLCIQEIVSTLMAGGCVCVPSEDDRFGNVASVIRSMRVNLVSLTPSFARQLSPSDVPSLRRMAFVGEALPKDQRDVWSENVWLLNSYGPSECSVIAAINQRVTPTTNPTNIGHIITGMGWIVHPDNDQQLMPIGATGELLIEGDLLGRGYLKDREKTDISFVENLNMPKISANKSLRRRYYKTGDLVRYDAADGSLIFEGRKDLQVKIRGQRVEVGEIEHHLGNLFSRASGAAVELLKHTTGVELVAFIFCDGIWDTVPVQRRGQLVSRLTESKIDTTAEIKLVLAKSLPRHMIPTRFRLVANRPLQPAGKLDRKKLREDTLNSDTSHFELEASTSRMSFLNQDDASTSRLSEKIINLVAANGQHSAVDLAGVDLNISALGLDSIQLISLLTYIKKEFDVKVPVGVLYDNKLTISGLVKMLSDAKSGTALSQGRELIDISTEIQNLYDEFLVAPQVQNPISKVVFLTGATGYLGSQILRQLLMDSSVRRVIVHVRAETSEEALDRLVYAASIGKWWSDVYLSRIECWPGDLQAPKLGLQEDQWKTLCGIGNSEARVDAIIHNGAAVQWQAPYFALKAANIDSTLFLLSAIRQWTVPGSFTYVSGGVKRAPDMNLDLYMANLRYANGYSQTKFIAEQLTVRFASRQPMHNISIVRPGMIIGTKTEGVPNVDDFLWKVVQACVSIGGYPADDQDYWLPVTDVEEVATSIILSTFNQAGHSDIVREIDTGLVVGEFWKVVQEELGYALKPMANSDWIFAIRSHLENVGDNHVFQPLMAMMQTPNFILGNPNLRSAESDIGVFSALRRNLKVLLSTGYLLAYQAKKDASMDQGHSRKLGTVFTRSSIHKAKMGFVTKVTS